MATRLNHGKPTGQYVGQIEGGWTLYCIGEDRYKICSIDAITGKANYSFAVRDRKLDPSGGLDAAKLKKEHPDLFDAVSNFLSNTTVAGPDEEDKYGDIALSRRRKPTSWQMWQRGVLAMRRTELEHTAAKRKTIWESAVRMLWAGIFKTKITDQEAARQVAYITKHAPSVNLELLLTAEQQFYAQKYAPNSCATLAAQLDTLAGEPDNIDDLL